MTRIAIVDNEKLKDSQLKLYIQSLCPINRTGKECIKIDDDGRLAIVEELCTGCGICPKAAPDAIKIINLPEELKGIPVHRYGENKFVLYSFPSPVFSGVIGILGINGIGKSTAIKILAGVIKPNLGEIGKEADYSKLVSFFKGTESQNFFENLAKGNIKVAYKPQQVELIPKTAKGKVIELLKKVDERKIIGRMIEDFGLGSILDNNLDGISGGELQRVAIAATIMKKADLYVFDEPTSYLDIKQRIMASRIIKSLADEETSVMVVEHDLIILDYITDFVHIMFGKESCYGVVSGLKPVKNGINNYLSGYIREENIRFREHPLKFADKSQIKKHSKDVLISWKGIKKSIGNFSLEADSGSIHKGEIVGILGENGIGKTTFVKILAHVLKQDSGDISSKVKVSYKPQYIESSDMLVGDVLSKAFEKYEVQVIRPLNLSHLALKRVDELSGGELQRVAIAHCLQQDAELYLLDEPSAYLDSEQRIVMSKVLRDFIEHKGVSALIVDHDILFIDYVSHRLAVFDGVPAIKGNIRGPFNMEDGMNMFLKGLGITLRRDYESNRPRVNKTGSRLDREQKEKGNYYYSD